jgi:hypothetical protein
MSIRKCLMPNELTKEGEKEQATKQEPNPDLENAIEAILTDGRNRINHEYSVGDLGAEIPCSESVLDTTKATKQLLSLLSPITLVKMELIERAKFPESSQWGCGYESGAKDQLSACELQAAQMVKAAAKEVIDKLITTLQNDGVLCTPEEAEKSNCSYCKQTYKDLAKY